MSGGKFRTVCECCGEKMPWRETYSEGVNDFENHKKACVRLSWTRYDDYTGLDFSVKWRRGTE